MRQSVPLKYRNLQIGAVKPLKEVFVYLVHMREQKMTP